MGATKYSLEYDKLPVMDKWLLSKLNTVIKEVDANLDNYRIPEAARARFLIFAVLRAARPITTIFKTASISSSSFWSIIFSSDVGKSHR